MKPIAKPLPLRKGGGAFRTKPRLRSSSYSSAAIYRMSAEQKSGPELRTFTPSALCLTIHSKQANKPSKTIP